MNTQALTVLALVITFTLLLIQRADPSRKKALRAFGWFMLVPLAIYIWWYGALWEALLAMLIALFVNGLFWLFIGRYNPVSSSDDIRVLGLDD